MKPESQEILKPFPISQCASIAKEVDDPDVWIVWESLIEAVIRELAKQGYISIDEKK